LKKSLANVHFDPTTTDLYKTIQESWKYANDVSIQYIYML